MSGVQGMSVAFKGKAAIVLAAAAVALLSGCAKRDSITVGAVPDDYRTNHPIIIAEKEETLDLPVGASDRGATASINVVRKGSKCRPSPVVPSGKTVSGWGCCSASQTLRTCACESARAARSM